MVKTMVIQAVPLQIKEGPTLKPADGSCSLWRNRHPTGAAAHGGKQMLVQVPVTGQGARTHIGEVHEGLYPMVNLLFTDNEAQDDHVIINGILRYSDYEVMVLELLRAVRKEDMELGLHKNRFWLIQKLLDGIPWERVLNGKPEGFIPTL
ncbi:hypothetical protein BTVI_02464 [Pitangus sulphuratus]|nr:hypothetical protein BTVI_02464 [Pitangus sulphuratus]